MSWLSRWIKSEETGTNIGISTSAFLTLVAQMFAITTLLQRVPYVTRMDRFILLSTLVVFAGLIQGAVYRRTSGLDLPTPGLDRRVGWNRTVFASSYKSSPSCENACC